MGGPGGSRCAHGIQENTVGTCENIMWEYTDSETAHVTYQIANDETASAAECWTNSWLPLTRKPREGVDDRRVPVEQSNFVHWLLFLGTYQLSESLPNHCSCAASGCLVAGCSHATTEVSRAEAAQEGQLL